VYPTTQLINGVDLVSIKNEELAKLIMEIVWQLHDPTTLRPELIG
jgi:hypothetical protein